MNNKIKKNKLTWPEKLVLVLIITLLATSTILFLNVRKDYKRISITLTEINIALEKQLEEKQKELDQMAYELSREKHCSLSFVECDDE